MDGPFLEMDRIYYQIYWISGLDAKPDTRQTEMLYSGIYIMQNTI